MIIAYPHTSNWDFVVGMLAMWSMGIDIRFWAKESLFSGAARFTLGPLIKAWGGVPVDRFAQRGMIDDTIGQMQRSRRFWLALSLEGTRRRTEYWKTGFYRVALAAKVPLGLAYFDFGRKTVGLTEFIMLSGANW
jgi:1-acyl-sn-glycerol-3-phosphate acyltransferase